MKSKKIIFVLLFIIIIVLLRICVLQAEEKNNILNIPVILQDGKINGMSIDRLCGVTCAEMILKYYGINDVKNTDIAELLATKLYPEYNKKMKYGEKDKIKYSTNSECSLSTGIQFSGTNLYVLKQYFESIDLKTEYVKTNYDKKSGKISDEHFNDFITYVRKGIPVIIHTEDHYMLVVGYSDVLSMLYINDPSDPKKLTIEYKIFNNRYNKWRPKKPKYLGWDGRYLAVF